MTTTEDTIEATCGYCGGRHRVQKPDVTEAGMFADLILKAASRAAHRECAEKAERDQRQRQHEEARQRQSEAWLTICPPAYRDTDPELLPCQDKSVQAWNWQFGPKGLTLHGRTGAGKTRTMFMVLEREHQAGRRIVATTHAEFSREATWQTSERREAQQRWLARWLTPDILFVDDLGKSRFVTADGTARAAEDTLFDVFDRRIRAAKPTMFTMQFEDGKKLAANMSEDKGEAFARRLRELTECIYF